MKVLIQFIYRFHVQFLFLVLVAFSTGLLVHYNHYQRATFFNVYSNASGSLRAMEYSVVSYFQLKKLNNQLITENTYLKNNLLNKDGKDWMGVVLHDSLQQNEYTFIDARVINLSTHKKLNYITLNKGRKDGLDVGMSVSSSEGVVGIIKGVSANYAVVLPAINMQSRISTKIDTTGYFGTLRWNGLNHHKSKLYGVEQNANIHLGQKVYTTGYGASFPSGVLVGRISSIKPDEEGLFYDIEIALATNFRSLYVVTVAKYSNIEEVKEIEQNEFSE